jgi:hypothetical protein
MILVVMKNTSWSHLMTQKWIKIQDLAQKLENKFQGQYQLHQSADL